MKLNFVNYKSRYSEIIKNSKKLKKEMELQYNLSETYASDGLKSCSESSFKAAEKYRIKLRDISGFQLLSDFLDEQKLRDKSTEKYDVMKIKISEELSDLIFKIDVNQSHLHGRSKKDSERDALLIQLFSGFIVDKTLNKGEILLEEGFCRT